MRTTKPVIIVDYDPRWPEVFAMLRSSVAVYVDGVAIAIEHVGSTAVPGLAAKPIIDMDIVVPSATEALEAISRLAVAGYVHRGDLGITGREAFYSPDDWPPHHLYVLAADNAELARHRAFRDYLIGRPDAAAAYARLKKELAAVHRDNRQAYNDGKAQFVQTALDSARDGAAR